MESFKELLYLIIYAYLGTISYIGYNLLFYHQKRLLFSKIIIYFSFIAYIWIKINYKYQAGYNFFYIISYLIGFLISKKLFDKELNSFNKKIEIMLTKIKYITIIIITPPIINYLKCRYHKYRFYKKYPRLKPSIYKLF